MVAADAASLEGENGARQYGIVLTSGDPQTAADLAADAEAAGAGLDRPFEIVVDGTTPADDPAAAAAIAGAHEAAGATWWTEADWTNPSPEALRDRIHAGPPLG